MRQLVSVALSRGGDYADLYFEYTVYSNLVLKDGEVTSGGSHTDYGVGIRVLKGDKTGYAYSESTDMPQMLSAAKMASAIALSSAEILPDGYRSCLTRATPGVEPSNHYPLIEPWRDQRISRFIPLLTYIDSQVRSHESRVSSVAVSMSWSETELMMFNSCDSLVFDKRPLYSLTVSAVFEQNGRREQKMASMSFRKGAETVTTESADKLVSDLLKGLDAAFEAGRPKGGKMPVVMGAGASGILLHEAMGHAFEADFNRKGQSIFSDKMGKKVCAPNISVIDDGTLPGDRGSINYDDEGIPGQKTYMVRDGILNSYLHDRISAAWYGVEPTGNGRREDFRFNPIPRMRSTYMDNGDAQPSDIIASVKKGIFVDEFSNGQVKIGEGDFTFFVKSGFLIENGRLTKAVKDINIIGNGPEALADIVAVGNDLKIDNGTWTCGKEQSVCVSCGMPTVLVKSLTVGGE